MKYKTLYNEILSHQDDFNVKNVQVCLMIIKHSKSEKTRQLVFLKLYFMLSKITLKAINNFFYLTKNMNKEDLLHNNDDIASECYFVFQKCAINCDSNKRNMFHFFYNTSLNRHIIRLCQKNYQKHLPKINASDDMYLFQTKTVSVQIDDLVHELDLRMYDFMDRKIIISKYSGEKKREFVKKYNINSQEYNERMTQIKTKLKQTYENDCSRLYFRDN